MLGLRSALDPAPPADRGPVLSALRALLRSAFPPLGPVDPHLAPVLVDVWRLLERPAATRRAEYALSPLDVASLSDSLASAVSVGLLTLEPRRRDHLAAPLPEYAPPHRESPPRVPRPPTNTAPRTFIAIRLVDQHGSPLAQRDVHFRFADYAERQYTTNAAGLLRYDDVADGPCTVTFRDLADEDFVEPSVLPGASDVASEGPVPPPEAERVHIVSAGETCSTIAHAERMPHFAAIWNARENAGLRARRKSPHTLLPGDAVAIPTRPPATKNFAAGAEHRVVVHTDELFVRLKLFLPDGASVLEATDAVRPSGAVRAPVTMEDGALVVPIRREATSVAVALGGESVDFQVGALAPIGEKEGVRQRLEHLGYDAGGEDDGSDEALRYAIESFEHDEKVKPRGELSTAFLDLLERVYGC